MLLLLADELILRVLLSCSYKSVASVAQCCRRLALLSSTSSLWHHLVKRTGFPPTLRTSTAAARNTDWRAVFRHHTLRERVLVRAAIARRVLFAESVLYDHRRFQIASEKRLERLLRRGAMMQRELTNCAATHGSAVRQRQPVCWGCERLAQRLRAYEEEEQTLRLSLARLRAELPELEAAVQDAARHE